MRRLILCAFIALAFVTSASATLFDVAYCLASGDTIDIQIDTDADTATITGGWTPQSGFWTATQDYTLRAAQAQQTGVSPFAPFDVTDSMLVDQSTFVGSGFGSVTAGWAFVPLSTSDTFDSLTWAEGVSTDPNFGPAWGATYLALTDTTFASGGQGFANAAISLALPNSPSAGSFLAPTALKFSTTPEGYTDSLMLVGIAGVGLIVGRRRQR